MVGHDGLPGFKKRVFRSCTVLASPEHDIQGGNA
jgi:hypothetical protein